MYKQRTKAVILTLVLLLLINTVTAFASKTLVEEDEIGTLDDKYIVHYQIYKLDSGNYEARLKDFNESVTRSTKEEALSDLKYLYFKAYENQYLVEEGDELSIKIREAEYDVAMIISQKDVDNFNKWIRDAIVFYDNSLVNIIVGFVIGLVILIMMNMMGKVSPQGKQRLQTGIFSMFGFSFLLGLMRLPFFRISILGGLVKLNKLGLPQNMTTTNTIMYEASQVGISTLQGVTGLAVLSGVLFSLFAWMQLAGTADNPTGRRQALRRILTVLLSMGALGIVTIIASLLLS